MGGEGGVARRRRDHVEDTQALDAQRHRESRPPEAEEPNPFPLYTMTLCDVEACETYLCLVSLHGFAHSCPKTNAFNIYFVSLQR